MLTTKSGFENYATAFLNFLDQSVRLADNALKMKAAGLLALCMFLATCAQAQFLTGPKVNPSNGHLYYLTVPMNWSAAESLALVVGGHLTTINNATENSWILGEFGNFGGVPRPLWIGLNDAAQEGTFVWASGEPVTYLNWSPVEPNDGAGIYPTEDHVHIWNSDSSWPVGSWNDAQEFLSYNGVVEVVPEPSSVCLLSVGTLLAMACHAQNRRR
jgi:hypothetical protein